MLGYLLFIIRLITSRFKYFKRSPRGKAHFLKSCGLYFEAGRTYMKHGYYHDALECFCHCKAYRHLLTCYDKLGQYKEALTLAQTHHLHKEGAKLCMRRGDLKKAAHFYCYFDVEQALQLYQQCDAFYEQGLCYLLTYRFALAFDCFQKCQDHLKRQKGYRHLEEVAVVYYLTKHYDESMHLFIKLKDYYSALQCAKKTKDHGSITTLRHLIARQAFSAGNYKEAAFAIAPINLSLAKLYNHLATSHHDAITLALYKKNYFLALHMSFLHNDYTLAKYITQVWLQDNNPYALAC